MIVSTFLRELPIFTVLPKPLRGSATSVIWLSALSASLMPNWAIVVNLRVTQLARILPRCFSPSRERGKSPLATNATISTTTWCSLRTALTITGTIEAR